MLKLLSPVVSLANIIILAAVPVGRLRYLCFYHDFTDVGKISYDEMMDVCVMIQSEQHDEVLMCGDRPQLVIHSVLASRVLFNLRRSDREEMEGSTVIPLETFRPAYGQMHTY